MKEPIYIASCSFGKDSIATILLALEHNEPLDRAFYAEVMFDKERNISGDYPEHIEWIYNEAKPKLEAMGVRVDIGRAKKDYITIYMHTMTKGMYIGKKQGFPFGDKCRINRDCKISAIKDYYAQFSEYDVYQYVGIAIDEPVRLQRLREKKNTISLMEKYNVTEAMAMDMCRSYGLVSPLYSIASRGGCWFCPNATYRGMLTLRLKHPELWHELELLANEDNCISYGFKYGKTFDEVQRKLDGMQLQMKLDFNEE